VAVLLALVVALVFALRRRDRIAAAAAVTALVAFGTATVVISRIPAYFDGAPFYRILQMWPVGCFVWLALAVNVGRALTPYAQSHFGDRLPLLRNAAFAMAVATLMIMPLAVARADSAVPDDTRAEVAVGRLAAELQSRLVRGAPYQIDVRTDNLFSGGAVSDGLFRELSRRGFDMRVDPRNEYLGRSHAAPANAAHLILRAGRRVGAPVGPGVEDLADAELASTADVDRMRDLDARLHDFLATPANLTARGRSLLAEHSSDPGAQALTRLMDPAADPQRANDGLVAIADGLVRTDGHVFNRLLAADSDAHTLAEEYDFSVYVAPAS
jgi:hypothetical protein